MVIYFDDFLKLFNLEKVSYEEFCEKLSILNISDKTGTFAVKYNIDEHFKNVVKDSDPRKGKEDLYKKNLYNILVVNAEKTLKVWFDNYVNLKMNVDDYFDIPNKSSYKKEEKLFTGMVNSRFGRICKNINFDEFYNVKKLYDNDSQYVFGLMKVMFENFHIRNSIASPAFFDHICRLPDDYDLFWKDFMMGANKASIFNPHTYLSILNEVFSGETLFAPVMGWNSYQQAFYSSRFKNFISTDVIKSVYENGLWLDKIYNERNFLFSNEKNIDIYLCPSEKLNERYNFIDKYKNSVDAVLFSPPYFDLEIYPGEEQSFTSFPNYNEWLVGYWEETVKLCKEVMKPNSKFGFVISNYRNSNGENVSISEDMRDTASKHLNFIDHYRIQWSVMGGSLQPKKTRDGNYEDLWIFLNS